MLIRRASLLVSLIVATPSLPRLSAPILASRDSTPIKTTALASATIASASSAPATSIVDSLQIFYIGRPAGWEHYELKPTEGGDGVMITSDYDYVDRGRRNHSALVMSVANDYAIRKFEQFRITDSARTVTTSVEFDGTHAKMLRNNKTTDVTIPAVAYVVSSYSPTAQHLGLIRYWEAHGMPKTIAIVPGDPNPVTIRKLGIDSVGTGANRIKLTRYTIDGVIWGINYLWLDSEGRLAMFATGGGGGLSFKTVRAALVPLRDELMDVATRAQMVELTRIATKTKPIAEGFVALVGATLIDATGAPAIPNST
ncbi:MAG: hypothetical protein ABJB66_00995, partial [Gemmatimonadaceae bacterium]